MKKRKISIKNSRTLAFLKEAFAELKKVVWPKKGEVIKKTIIVLASMLVIATIIGTLDYGLYQAVKFLINFN